MKTKNYTKAKKPKSKTMYMNISEDVKELYERTISLFPALKSKIEMQEAKYKYHLAVTRKWKREHPKK